MSAFSVFEYFGLLPGSRKTYFLEQELTWEISVKGSGWFLIIPANTCFDISVPRVLEFILSPHDRGVLLAALIHDELLIKGHDAAFASAEFRRALKARGKSSAYSWALFFATLIWTAFGVKTKQV